MKKILLSLIAIIIFVILFHSYTSTPSIIIANLTKKQGDISFGNLKYRIYALGFIPIAEAVFQKAKEQNYNGKEVYSLAISVKSLSFWTKLFKGSATMTSYIDKKQLHPLVYQEDVYLSSKPTAKKEVIYDQDKNTMLLREEVRKILPHTQDPISAFYNIMNMNLYQTKDIDININTNQKNYALKGSLEQEKLVINKKPYDLFKLKSTISRRDGNPYHKTQMTLFMIQTKENKNIPILVNVFSCGFLIKAKLIEIL